MKTHRPLIVTLFIISFLTAWTMKAGAQDFKPFLGVVTGDDINLRTDSTVSAPVIQKAEKGVYLQVIFEHYDWYKVKLPKTCPSYIKKTLVEPLSEKAGKVIKNTVNIRLGPSESTAVIGRAHRDEVLTIVSTEGDWYRIEPVDNSFGWISKRFLKKATAPPAVAVAQTTPAPTQQKMSAQATLAPVQPLPAGQLTLGSMVTVQGVVKPYGKVFWRKATHKLLQQDQTFLLKGNKKTLDALNYHTVKIQGKLIDMESRYPIIEIEKTEALD